ncbi:hypothetical protein H310_14774 [Aphanomyces invadans]|uniref:Uncharacterized protein n=1 Tax=Aphanomyces invadans TaxID=157072 RepID=A0A024TA22_9STRA|nr:hypothetical protein H310_14774 [Aphanomyces invadans]ETV90451.1 hypothetical protein H310_14774 [Aphanomyces invadans]|eukprot:XP_008880925.1 hypothetical protein H310_14774 [Aphanomyces invadans]
MEFVDPSVIDNCSFHTCERYAWYERERVVSFVPLDEHLVGGHAIQGTTEILLPWY